MQIVYNRGVIAARHVTFNIPGIYKTKILQTQDGNKDVKDEMINLSKFRKIADIIIEIKLYQNDQYRFQPEPRIQVHFYLSVCMSLSLSLCLSLSLSLCLSVDLILK